MTKDEALRLALEALDSILANHKGAPVLPWIEAKDAIKAVLEAEDELTIAYMSGLHRGKELAQRPWVELTMDDFTDILKLASEGRPLEIWELFKAVENKAREKNT